MTTEQDVLTAYRCMDDRAKKEWLQLGAKYAKEYPARPAPILKLVSLQRRVG